jgi:hypothetical protein
MTNKKTLLNSLRKYEHLFDDMLGHWQSGDYEIALKSDATPYHVHPYPILKAYKQAL